MAGRLLSAAVHRDGELLRTSATRMRYALLLRSALLRGALLGPAGLGRAELGRAVLRPVGVGGGHAVPVCGRGLAGELRLVTRVPHLVAVHGRAVPGGYRGWLLRSGLRLLPAGLLPRSLLSGSLLSGHLLHAGLLRPSLLKPSLLGAALLGPALLGSPLLGAALLLARLLLSCGLRHRALLRPEPGRKLLRLRLRRWGRRRGGQAERRPGCRPGYALCAGAARTGVHEAGSARCRRGWPPARHPAGPGNAGNAGNAIGSTGNTCTCSTGANMISWISSASRPARTHAARGPGLPSGRTGRRASCGRGSERGHTASADTVGTSTDAAPGTTRTTRTTGTTGTTGAARTTGAKRASGAHPGHLPSRSDRSTRAARSGHAPGRASRARYTAMPRRSARTCAQRRPSRAARHPPRIARVQRPRHGGKQHPHRELVPFLLQVPHLLPGDDDLEHAAVDLPVAELPGAPFVHAEVDDVQPVAEVVQDETRLAAVVTDRAGLPQRADLTELDVLAPDAAGCGGEAVLLGRRRGGEKGDVAVGGTDGGLV